MKTIIHGDAETALGAALRLASWRGIAVEEIPVRTGLPPEESRSATRALVEEGAREAGGRLFDASIVEVARALMEEAVDAFHRDEPLRPGITVSCCARQYRPTMKGDSPTCSSAKRSHPDP